MPLQHSAPTFGPPKVPHHGWKWPHGILTVGHGLSSFRYCLYNLKQVTASGGFGFSSSVKWGR